MAGVLLTDGQQRKALAAARSLGPQGYHVLVADDSRFSTTRFSRHVAQGLLSPSPADGDAYWRWLLEIGRRESVESLLPMDDLTTALAVAHQAELPFQALLPTRDQFQGCQDKGRTMELAWRAGVRTPRTRAVATEAEALAAFAEFDGSVVVKARTASGGRGIFFASSPEQVKAAWRKARPEWGGFLIQERIPLGRKFDVCLLYGPTGDLRATFVQEELRWFPLEHGTSTLQESAARPDLVLLAHRLLSPMGWRGPVEVEFMEPPGAEPVLMEVNPRFWASMALAIRCGIDFPGLTVRIAAGEPVRGPDDYPLGVRCRWLLPGDLLHFFANPRRLAMDPGLFTSEGGRTKDDIFSWDDPLPTLGFTLAVARHIWSPQTWRMILRW